MTNQIHAAIKCLESYKENCFESQVSAFDHGEIKLRESCINTVINKLTQFLIKPSPKILDGIIAEINEVTHDRIPEARQEFVLIEDKFTTILNKTQTIIKDYRRKRSVMEQTRDKVNNYFSDFPKKVEQLTNNINNVIQSIESELNYINCELLITSEKYINSLSTNKIENDYALLWRTISEIYVNTSQHIYNCELDIFNQPLNFERKLSVNDQQVVPNKIGVVVISHVFLNLALNVRHYYNQIQQYLNLKSVQGIKTNIRHLYRLCSRIEKTFNKIIEAKQTLHNKVVTLYSQSQFRNQNEMLKMIQFIDKIFVKFDDLLEEVTEFRKSASLIFAYVLDESVLRIRRKNVMSRLDLLLSGKDFEPIDEEKILHAYEEHIHRAALAIKYGSKNAAVINQPANHLNA